jgi:hypothetical protein
VLAEWFPALLRILMPSFTESSIPRRIMTQITVFIGTGTCTIESNYVTEVMVVVGNWVLILSE